jgi:hypothetical protein
LQLLVWFFAIARWCSRKLRPPEAQLPTLPPGIYRVDVLLDADTVWRTFFRMVE